MIPYGIGANTGISAADSAEYIRRKEDAKFEEAFAELEC
jgi:hypothetical protein